MDAAPGAGLMRIRPSVLASLALALGVIIPAVVLWREWTSASRGEVNPAPGDAQGLPKLLPPQLGGATPAQEDLVTRAALKAWSGLAEAQPDFDSRPVLDIAVREDGTLFNTNSLIYSPQDRSAFMSDPAQVLPQDAGNIAGIMFHPGDAGDAPFKHPVWIRYVILRKEPDTSRAVKRVWAAALTAHRDLLQKFPVSRVNLVTAYMSNDGRIDKYYVESSKYSYVGTTRETGDALPDGDQIPEEFARHWEPLGLKPEQLGPMGVTQINALMNRNAGPDSPMGMMIVRYAWPRRDGEPIGGVPLAERRPRILRFLHADAAAVIEHYFNGALNDKGRTLAGIPWLVMSRDGSVVRNGFVHLGFDESATAHLLETVNPDLRIGEVLESLVVKQYATSYANRVIFAWLAPPPGVAPQ
jgi:hypothetical protein